MRYLLPLVALLLLLGCATNPVSGKKQLMMISKEKEIKIGESADEEIRRRFGVYTQDQNLRSYVDQVGSSLARNSHWSDLIYHFEILDAPMINAFALPGGFVYITRGIVERMNSEDELAAVLGHEIGHVAARHGAARISKVYGLQLLTIGIAVFTPGTVQNWGDLINLAVNLGLQGYSRHQEREADELGITYATLTGYNPEGALHLFETFHRLQDHEPTRLETFLLSHPPTNARIQLTKERLEAYQKEDPLLLQRTIRHNEYLQTIDGLVVGPGNEMEFVTDGHYYNTVERVAIRIPPGWKVDINQPKALVAFLDTETEDTVLLLDRPLHFKMTLEDFVAEFEKEEGKRWEEEATDRLDDFLTKIYKSRDRQNRPIKINAAYRVADKKGVVFLGFSLEERFESALSTFNELIRSIAFLSPEEVEAIGPPRLRLYKVREGDTWESISQKELSTDKLAEKLALYNGMTLEETPLPGRLIKISPQL